MQRFETIFQSFPKEPPFWLSRLLRVMGYLIGIWNVVTVEFGCILRRDSTYSPWVIKPYTFKHETDFDEVISNIWNTTNGLACGIQSHKNCIIGVWSRKEVKTIVNFRIELLNSVIVKCGLIFSKSKNPVRFQALESIMRWLLKFRVQVAIVWTLISTYQSR